jgi:MauM/NapG family ferredoxin protein
MNAIRFGIKKRRQYSLDKIDYSRRKILISIGIGVISSIYIRSHRYVYDIYLLRPPGALSEDKFGYTCIRCGACIKVCVTQGLVLDFLSTGIIGIGTPKLVPRLGACEAFCNLCGIVCPSGAIKRVAIEEKKYVRIGVAKINKDKCIAYKEGKLCIICDEQCGYNAIYLSKDKKPVIDGERCTGCGVCENRCPLPGEAAIRVVRLDSVCNKKELGD